MSVQCCVCYHYKAQRYTRKEISANFLCIDCDKKSIMSLHLEEIEELLSIIEAHAQTQQPVGIEARAKKAKEILKKMKEDLK